jgi:hypothetical protein
MPATTLYISSNLKALTSGAAPTTTNLLKGEFAIGLVGSKYAVYANYTGSAIVKVGEFGGDDPAAGLLLDFQASHAYAQYETIFQGGYIYRAKQAFTSSTAFNPTNWDMITTPGGQAVSVALNFQANHDYEAYEIIVNAGTTYRAKTTFTSSTAFNEADWEAIGGSLSPDQAAKLAQIIINDTGDAVLADDGNYKPYDPDKNSAIILDGDGDLLLADDGSYVAVAVQGAEI